MGINEAARFSTYVSFSDITHVNFDHQTKVDWKVALESAWEKTSLYPSANV